MNEKLTEIKKIINETGNSSIEYLHRRLGYGYGVIGRLLDELNGEKG